METILNRKNEQHLGLSVLTQSTLVTYKEKKMTEDNRSLWRKFMDIHYLLPYGNGGRGTKIHLYPFVFVAVVAAVAPLINFAMYGNF